MRKISIIALVSFFFALCMVVINIALALEYKRQISELNYFAFQRFIMAVKLSNNVPLNELDEQLRPLNVKLSQHTKESVASNGEVILEDPMFDMMRYNKTLFLFLRKKSFINHHRHRFLLKSDKALIFSIGHRRHLCH